MYLAIKMKKFPLLLAVIIFTFSCGTKRVIYNNQKQQPEKELKTKKPKPKKKKTKKIIVPKKPKTTPLI